MKYVKLPTNTAVQLGFSVVTHRRYETTEYMLVQLREIEYLPSLPQDKSAEEYAVFIGGTILDDKDVKQTKLI
jgi:hypothetical protein